MQADWEVEIGGEAPVIDGCWEGLVDLRVEPGWAALLPEAQQLPGLADTLSRLNSPTSPVWTTKSDVWCPVEFDPDELDARPGDADCAISCYIDLLPRTKQQWLSVEQAVADCRTMCELLRGVALRCCRADLIVRRAYLASRRQNQGITAYITACGPTVDKARATLESALRVFAQSVVRAGTTSTLQ